MRLARNNHDLTVIGSNQAADRKEDEMSRWKKIDEKEANRLIAAAEEDGVVVKFLVPQECAGQIIEYSYAGIGQYGILQRGVDRSDGTVSWCVRAWRRDDEENPGLNYAPR